MAYVVSYEKISLDIGKEFGFHDNSLDLVHMSPMQIVVRFESRYTHVGETLVENLRCVFDIDDHCSHGEFAFLRQMFDAKCVSLRSIGRPSPDPMVCTIIMPPYVRPNMLHTNG